MGTYGYYVLGTSFGETLELGGVGAMHAHMSLPYRYVPCPLSIQRFCYPLYNFPKNDVTTLVDATGRPGFFHQSQVSLNKILTKKKTAGSFVVCSFLLIIGLLANFPPPCCSAVGARLYPSPDGGWMAGDQQGQARVCNEGACVSLQSLWGQPRPRASCSKGLRYGVVTAFWLQKSALHC